MGRGVGWGSGRSGGSHGPAGSRQQGQHGQLAAPTVAAPTQAAKLSHLEDIGPPPVPYMKKQPSWAGGKASFLWEAIEERLFAQKGFNPSKLSRRPPKPRSDEGASHYET